MEWILVLGVGAVVLWVFARRSAARKEQELASRFAPVRRVAAEDVTQLGEQLAAEQVDISTLDAGGSEDWHKALDSYDSAKQALDSAKQPEDLQWVSRALDDGRFSLARLTARRAGLPLPERRPPCFFDQRHGLSTDDRAWTPEGGSARDVPVCSACAARLDDGLQPQGRMVETARGERPYWEAGRDYAPWAGGWYGAYGGHVLPALLVGTMLGSSVGGWGSGGGDGSGDGGDAGDSGDSGDGGGDGGGSDTGGGGYESSGGGWGDSGGGGWGDGGGGGFDGGGF